MPVANEWGWVATGELIGCWGRRPVAGGTLCVRDATNWGARTTGELLGASAAGGGDSPGEGSSRHGFNGKIPHTVVSCAPCAVCHVLRAMCCVPCAVCWEDLAGTEVTGQSGLLKCLCEWEWGDGPQGWVDSSR